MVIGHPVGQAGGWHGWGHIGGGGAIIIGGACIQPVGQDGGIQGCGHIEGAAAMVIGHPIGQEGAWQGWGHICGWGGGICSNNFAGEK